MRHLVLGLSICVEFNLAAIDQVEKLVEQFRWPERFDSRYVMRLCQTVFRHLDGICVADIAQDDGVHSRVGGINVLGRWRGRRDRSIEHTVKAWPNPGPL